MAFFISSARWPRTLERMSKTKQAVVSGVVSALLVAVLFLVLGLVEGSLAGRIFVAAGFPLGALSLQVLPDSVLRAVAPEGGPNAVAWVFAFSALATWFVLVFAVCFVLLGRMRSNSAPHRDGREAARLGQPSSAPARGRER